MRHLTSRCALTFSLLVAACGSSTGHGPSADVDATNVDGGADSIDPDTADTADADDDGDWATADATGDTIDVDGAIADTEVDPDGDSDATDLGGTRDTAVVPDGSGDDPGDWIEGWRPERGATVVDGQVSFAIVSPNATRVEAWLYAAARDAGELTVVPLERSEDGLWRGTTPLPEGARWYGLRLWGPNWPWDPAWIPGSLAGYVSDVDAEGNRFNPNKLVYDPWALELSHDPRTALDADSNAFRSGPDHRATDSAFRSPKGLLLSPQVRATRPPRPTRPLNDDVIYEVHVRNFTRNAFDLPESVRGTYAGAAARAEYLASIGVTAIEFLPLHETQNEQNDIEVGTSGDNMWGYASLSYFAPERRYSSDNSPGGTTRELMEMVDAFHAVGIKVFVDVVYNHTAEGGAWGDAREMASILSWRGVDNATFYQVFDGLYYRNDNGVGPNVRVTTDESQQMVLDSLAYWHHTIGVDGFRFDLASVLGNTCEGNCFRYSPDFLLSRIADELGARPVVGGEGVDLIAEPWAIGAGTYQVGNYPAGWWEWNDRFRDMVRELQNVPSVAISASAWINRLDGSSDLFGTARSESATLNYVASHDGMTFHDLYRCNGSHNTQAWPWGPSNGGESYNRSWDQGSNVIAQRQATRTGLALLLLSGGPVMFNGGDERLRSQRCNNNPYNLDSDAMGLDWVGSATIDAFVLFASRLLAFRSEFAELRRRDRRLGVDSDGDTRDDLVILDRGGSPASAGERDDSGTPVFAWRLDLDGAAPGSIVVAYNRSPDWQTFFLPTASAPATWWRVCDTDDFAESFANCAAPDAYYRMGGLQYDLNPRSLVVWLER